MNALERKYLGQQNNNNSNSLIGVEPIQTVSAHHPPGSKIQTDLLGNGLHQPKVGVFQTSKNNQMSHQ